MGDINEHSTAEQLLSHLYNIREDFIKYQGQEPIEAVLHPDQVQKIYKHMDLNSYPDRVYFDMEIKVGGELKIYQIILR